MAEIRSKIHQYGHKNESEWPSQFGTGEKGVFHHDGEKVVEGTPPPKYEKHGQAPIAIMDSMDRTYHEGACREVESRKEWDRLDKETGSLTFGSRKEVSEHTAKARREKERALKQDRRNAALTATRAYRENRKEVKDKLRRRDEEQREVLKKSGLGKHLKEAGIRYE
jgi:hypothetical protein